MNDNTPSDDTANRLRVAMLRIERAEKKAAAANTENEALRREVRTLRYSNFILSRNAENSTEGNYRNRYEKLEEAMKIIRELARTEVNGIPYTPPQTLEPWSVPYWARDKATEKGTDQ